jgi:hypothetical protein
MGDTKASLLKHVNEGVDEDVEKPARGWGTLGVTS